MKISHPINWGKGESAGVKLIQQERILPLVFRDIEIIRIQFQ